MFSESRNDWHRRIRHHMAADHLRDRDVYGNYAAWIGDYAAGIVNIAAKVISC